MTRDPMPLPRFSWCECLVILALAGLVVGRMLLGCATTGAPSAAKSWEAALASYQALATGMEVYCASDAAKPVPCLQAGIVSLKAEETIQGTKDDLAAGRSTEATLKAAAAALRAAEPALQKVQPPKEGN